jgi:hypothetical protein
MLHDVRVRGSVVSVVPPLPAASCNASRRQFQIKQRQNHSADISHFLYFLSVNLYLFASKI